MSAAIIPTLPDFKIGDPNYIQDTTGFLKRPATSAAITSGNNVYSLTPTPSNFMTLVYVPPKQTPLFADLQPAVPLAARSNPPYKAGLTYENRPLIEIVQQATKQVLYKYDDLFITGLQEQDSEKMETVETFGAPHTFASGRFSRKYTFSGMVRSTPIDDDSSLPQFYVSQNAGFREFYDQYMRVTIQARNGWFTRLTIDKDIYEGYASSFNYHRDAHTDSTIPFVFSLTGTKRAHALITPSDARLSITRNRPAADPVDGGTSGVRAYTQAYTEEPPTNVIYRAPLKWEISDTGKVTGSTARLNVGTDATSFTVIPNRPGVGLFTAAGALVTAGLTFARGIHDLTLRVTDFPLYYASIRRPLDVIVFSLKSNRNKPVTITGHVSISAPRTISMNRVVIRNPITSTVLYDGPAKSAICIEVPLAQTTSAGEYFVDVDAYLTKSGTTAYLNIVGTTAYAAIGPGCIKTSEDVGLAFEQVGNTYDADLKKVTANLVGSPVRDGFGAAGFYSRSDRFVVKLTGVLQPTGHEEIRLPPIQCPVYYGPTPANSALKTLTLLGAVYQPQSIKYSNGKSAQQTGFLSYALTFNTALPVSILSALRAGGTLIITPRSGTNILVPLSGVFGNGKVNGRVLKWDTADPLRHVLTIQMCGDDFSPFNPPRHTVLTPPSNLGINSPTTV